MTRLYSNVELPNKDNPTYLDWEKFFTVICPTSNNLININTYTALLWVSKGLNRPLTIISSRKNGIPAARNECLKIAKSYYGTDSIRGLWLDNDLWLKSTNETVEAIKYADEHNITIAAKYNHMGNDKPEPVMYRERESAGTPYSHEELEALPDMAPIGAAGLGFVYGEIPLNYEFHAEGFLGEDFAYIIDNDIILHYAKKIQLAHYQGMFV